MELIASCKMQYSLSERLALIDGEEDEKFVRERCSAGVD
jgi:hypothetical protein